MSQIRAFVRSPHALVRVALTGLWLAAAPLPAAGRQTGLDESPGLVGLSLPLGARAVGQGRAIAAASGELQGLPYNPATVVGLQRGALTYSRFEGAEHAGVSGNYLAGAYATRWGTIGVHLVLLDYGEIPLTESSPEPLGTIEVQDWAAGVTYARRVWNEKVAVGATAKWLSSDLGTVQASGPAFDVGLLYDPREDLPLGLAVALRNLGPDLDFGGAEGENAGEALPSRVRIAVNLHPEAFPGLPPEVSVVLGFDTESVLRELSTTSLHAGTAVTIRDAVVVRGGLLLLDNPFARGATENRNTGGSIGVGVRLGGFEADVAREISVSELGDEMHFAVGWRF